MGAGEVLVWEAPGRIVWFGVGVIVGRGIVSLFSRFIALLLEGVGVLLFACKLTGRRFMGEKVEHMISAIAAATTIIRGIFFIQISLQIPSGSNGSALGLSIFWIFKIVSICYLAVVGDIGSKF